MGFGDFDFLFNKIKRLMVAKNQKELAVRLGVTPQAVSNAKTDKVIPETWYQIIFEKHGITKEALIQQTKNEYNAAHPHAQGHIAPMMSFDPGITPGDKSTDREMKQSEMMYMTGVVLESNTVYRSALASNIRAFYQAVKGEQEMNDLRDDVKRLSEEIAELKEIILSNGSTEKKRASNDH